MKIRIIQDWIYLIMAGLCETFWALSMKYSSNFSKLLPSVFTFIGLALSILFMSNALRSLPVGVCYIVLTSIGTIGTVLYGIVFFEEPLDITKICCISIMITSMVIISIRS